MLCGLHLKRSKPDGCYLAVLCEPAHQLVKFLGVEPLPFIFAVDIVPR